MPVRDRTMERNIFQPHAHFNDYFLDAVLDSSIVSRTNRAGIITFVNQNFETVSGYDKEELVGKSHNVINSGIHPREFWMDMWQKITCGVIWRAEVCNRSKNGALYWVDTFVYPYFNERGELTEFFSIRNDITQRKLNKEELLRSESQLRAILDSTTDAYFLVGKDKEIITYNRTARKMVPSSIGPEKLLSAFDQLARRQEGSEDRFQKALQGMYVDLENEISFPDGRKEWYRIRYLPTYDKAQTLIGVSVILTNIHMQKMQEREIQHKNQKLLEIAWSQSHEMRRPVASILGLIQLIQKDEEWISSEEFIMHLKAMTDELDTSIRKNVNRTYEYGANSPS